MLKASYFNRQDCAISGIIFPKSLGEALAMVRTCELEGADAICLDIKDYAKEDRTEDNFRRIVQSVCLPFMVTDYRNDIVAGADDEARQEFLLMALRAGAEVVDVMGDLFAPAEYELTREPHAIARQKELISKIHDMGGKVVMSSHMSAFRTCEQVLEHYRQQESRGADILKMVVKVDTDDEFGEFVRTLCVLRHEIQKPYIFLPSGAFARPGRYLGTRMGVAVQFATPDYVACPATYAQPSIRSMQAVKRNMIFALP